MGGIRVNHKGLRQAGYQCLTCHANISHPGTRLEVARISQNKMSICARCHDGKKLSNACDLCHISGIPATAPKVAMKLHVSPGQCAECHTTRTFCTKCHNGLRMPHPQHWTKAHGSVVLSRGKNICVSCHLKDIALAPRLTTHLDEVRVGQGGREDFAFEIGLVGCAVVGDQA